MIHSTAVIHPDAGIGEDVEIGPYSVIGAGVKVGAGTWVGAHAVIKGPTVIGKNNRIYQFTSIGEDPQDKKFRGEADSTLLIGDGNTVREFCTINRGTAGGGGVTRIGNDNWIMASVHIAHDCIIGDGNVFANNTALAGHVLVANHAILGGYTGVHQFCRIGSHTISAIASVIVKDVPPYVMVAGNTARPAGLNREGLKRLGMESTRIDRLRKAYKIVYREGLLLKDAMKKLEVLVDDHGEVTAFADFIRASTRGIVR